MTRCLLAVSAAIALTAGCGSTDEHPKNGDDGSKFSEALVVEAMKTHSKVALALYEDSLAAAEDLRGALHAFVAAPSETTFAAAKAAWLAAREPYAQSEALRFASGPIDHPDTGVERLLDATRLDVAYVDYVLQPIRDEDGAPVLDEDGNPAFEVDHVGIVNDTSVTLDAATLEALHQKGGERDVAVGFHAIELLLWGQDFDADGPGRRPYTDYVAGDDGTALNQDRRGAYLSLLGDMLVQHLGRVVDAWKEGDPSNYRASFEAQPAAEGLRRILAGTTVLTGTELAGERLQVVLDGHDEEGEHSAFSDNTHRDLVNNTTGARTSFLGSYTRTDGTKVEGTGVFHVLHAIDDHLADHMLDHFDANIDLAEKIRAPFDREIAADNPEGNARVLALIHALRHQEEMLVELFTRFDLPAPPLEQALQP